MILKKSLLLFLVCVFIWQGWHAYWLQQPDRHLSRSEQLLGGDYRWIYVAGKCWLQGVSPHKIENFYPMWEKELGLHPTAPVPLAYPPTLALVAVPLALFSWDHSRVIFDILNFISMMLCFFFVYRILVDLLGIESMNSRLLFALAMTANLFPVTRVLHTGQTVFFVVIGMLATVYFLGKKREWLAAFFSMFASIKPHLSLFLFLILFLQNRQFFLKSFVMIGSFCLLTIAATWEHGIIKGMFESIYINADQNPYNAIANLSVFFRILHYFGLQKFHILCEIFGIFLSVSCLYLFSKRGYLRESFSSGQLVLVTWVFALPIFFMPTHDYDQCLLIFPLVTLFIMKASIALTAVPAWMIFSRPRMSTALITKYFPSMASWSVDDMLLTFGPLFMFLSMIGLIGRALYSTPQNLFPHPIRVEKLT